MMTDQSLSRPARVKAAKGHTSYQGGQVESRGRERELSTCRSRYSAEHVVLTGTKFANMNDQTFIYVASWGGAGPSQRIKIGND